VRIDEATVSDADNLTHLALASKRHWGYDDAFMERCRDELTVSEADVATHQVLVAREAERVLGFYQLLPPDQSCVVLDMLFVEPRSIGAGVGGALMRHAMSAARGDGALTLRITADPFAVPFYEHFGAVLVGSSLASSTGRTLPVYDIAL
jgi:GNAT superfamily N-acetyltransferase